MSYATQRDALARTPQELLVIGVRECQNAYALTRAQLLQYTEQMDNAAWVKGSVTVTANAATAPDGTTTADACTFNADNDTLDQTATGEAVTSKAFTFSVWMRVAAGTPTITIRCRNVANTEGTSKQVTLSTTWTRYYVHKLFTGTPVDDAMVRIVRIAGDTINGDVYVWGANLTRNPSDANLEVPFPYVQRVTAAVNASKCAISDQGVGSRCYYSRPTCQDADNFNAGNTWEDTARGRGIREYRMCRKDSPLPLAGTETLPYLVASPQAAQEIDPEKSLTVNDRVTFEFEDDVGPGVWNPRQSSEGMLVNTATGGGSFWPRWAAIYRNYANPEGYVKRYHGFVEAGMTEADFQARGRYLIRNYERQNHRVRLVCGDRLRLTRKDIPAKISEDNTLQRRLGTADVTVYVNDASEFAPVSPSDYTVAILIDSEKMNVTAVDLSTNTLTVTRGRWGTTAAEHSRSAAITAVAEFGTERSTPSLTPLGKNPIDIVIELLKYGGLGVAEIDVAGLQAQRDYWHPSTVDTTEGTYSGSLLRRSLTDVTDVETLLREIRAITMLWLWVSDAQMVTGRFYAPVAPADTVTDLTDDANIIADSVEVDDNDESRLSRVLLAYYLPAGESATSAEDFALVRVELDIDSEEREYYGDRRLLAVLSEWLQPVTASGISTEAHVAKYFTQKVLSRFRYGVRIVSCKLEMKDDDLDVGDMVRLDTMHLQDVHGANSTAVMHVVKKKREGSRIAVELLDTAYHKRAGFYTGPAYPVYTSATADEQKRGFYGDTRGQVGTPRVPGYVYC